MTYTMLVQTSDGRSTIRRISSSTLPSDLTAPWFTTGDEYSHTECPDRCGLPHAGKVIVPIGQILHRRTEHLRHHAMLPAQHQHS
jgi:hypothetical protein